MITSDRQLIATNKKIESLQESVKKLSEESKEKLLAKASLMQTKSIIKEMQLY